MSLSMGVLQALRWVTTILWSFILMENIYTRLKRNDELKLLYSEFLAGNPGNIYWLNRAGHFALSISDYKYAEQRFEQAFQKSNSSGTPSLEAFNGYLEALLLSKQTDKLFEQANIHLTDSLAPIAYLQMADAENRRGNADAAVKYARNAADAIQKDETLYQTLKAMIKVIGQKNFEAYAAQRLSKEPSNLPVLMVNYELQLSVGDFDQAIETIDKCIEITKNDPNRQVSLMVQKASIYYGAFAKTSDKNYIQKAIQQYESVIGRLPKNNRSADVLNNLAYMLADSNDRPGDAVKYIQEAVSINPSNPDYAETYAFVLYKNGKFSEAQQYIQSAIQLFNVQQRKISWKVFEHAALISEKLNSRLQAIAYYKDALQAGLNEMSNAEKTAVNNAIERLSKEE